MEKLILGDQYGRRLMMFGTSFSSQILHGFNIFKKRHKSAKSWGQKLDLLFGFTFAIYENDVWMHAHYCGWGGEKMMASLARMWKNCLAKSNNELELDGEFTRPGLEEFLSSFKKEVENVDTYEDPPMKFRFK